MMANGRSQWGCVVAAELHTLSICKQDILIHIIVIDDPKDGIPERENGSE
jgi:hypothetical protein